jgi:hypothetical protein
LAVAQLEIYLSGSKSTGNQQAVKPPIVLALRRAFNKTFDSTDVYPRY